MPSSDLTNATAALYLFLCCIVYLNEKYNSFFIVNPKQKHIEDVYAHKKIDDIVHIKIEESFFPCFFLSFLSE